MMRAFNQRLESALAQRNEQGLNRALTVVKNGNQSNCAVNGSQWVNFSSNDYLGLAADKQLSKHWQKGIELFGNGSAASPLVTGFTPAHSELESRLCDWLGYQRAILFSSGFSANQAMLFCLLEKNDLLLQDKLNHASLIEAGMLCPAMMKRFRHNNAEHLNTLLNAKTNNLIVTEGVFSMDGDKSPLQNIDSLRCSNTWLAVDDAHGIGVLGKHGRGSCNEAGIKPDVLVVTFGKAFGLSGAAILCNHTVGDYLTQFARHHVYSTAIPPAQAYALTQAIDLVADQQWRRDKLTELSDEYQQQFSDLEEYVATETPIKPLLIGEANKAVEIANYARGRGFWLTAIRPPTVPVGSARLRITLTANHTLDDLRGLSKAIKPYLSRS